VNLWRVVVVDSLLRAVQCQESGTEYIPAESLRALFGSWVRTIEEASRRVVLVLVCSILLRTYRDVLTGFGVSAPSRLALDGRVLRIRYL